MRKLCHAVEGESGQWFQHFVFEFMAGNEEGQWEEVVQETQALNYVESLAEILQLKEQCSILKGEVQALRQEAKQCTETLAQLHEVESFFIQMKVFLDVSALRAVPKG